MMKEKTILILGTGIMQIPALKAARNMGLYVYAADVNDKAPGIPLAHEFLHIDLRDKEKMAQAAETISRKRSLDGVFTAGTDFSTTVAWVAEKLGLPGISYETALNCTDKGRMREVFAKAKIPSPPFCVVREGSSTPGELPPMPVVVKPVDNMGARGIRKIDREEDLPEAIESALTYSRALTCVVEGYVPGPEYSIDSLVYGGNLSLCGFADRHIHFPPCFVEMGHTIPGDMDAETMSRIMDVFTRAVLALGIHNGAAKGDVKLSPDGPVIGEIAARLSGGYMSGWTFPYSSGVEVTKAAINIALGLPPGNLHPIHSRVSAERAFISIPGSIKSLEGEAAASSLPHVKNLFLARKSGDRIVFPRNNVEKCGNVISCAHTREEAVKAAEDAVRMMLVRLVPGDKETFGFLYGLKPEHAPDAFTLSADANREAYRTMPVITPGTARGNPTGLWNTIFTLPFPDLEFGRDWHGTGFSAALERVRKETGVTRIPWTGAGKDRARESDSRTLISGGVSPETPGSGCLGKLFWKAFLRGGIQGGIWIIETVRDLGAESDMLREGIHSWAD